MDLRKKLIRLAYEKPELRTALLPILKNARPEGPFYQFYVQEGSKPGTFTILDPVYSMVSNRGGLALRRKDLTGPKLIEGLAKEVSERWAAAYEENPNWTTKPSAVRDLSPSDLRVIESITAKGRVVVVGYSPSGWNLVESRSPRKKVQLPG